MATVPSDRRDRCSTHAWALFYHARAGREAVAEAQPLRLLRRQPKPGLARRSAELTRCPLEEPRVQPIDLDPIVLVLDLCEPVERG